MTIDPHKPNHGVAVVIPTRNRAGLLVEAVDSVLAQTVPADEVIVVNDASSDDTLARLDQFRGRIEVISMEHNVERGFARNAGAGASSSPLLAFLDSDDIWEPKKLEQQLRAFDGQVPSVTGIALMDDQGSPTGRVYLPASHGNLSLLAQNNMLGSASSILLPRAAFEEVGGFPEDRQFQGSEDWLFLVKLLWAGWSTRSIREPLVRYRVHSGGWTHQPDNVARSMWAATRWLEVQQLGPPRMVAERRSKTAAAIASAYASRGDWRQALRWARRALGQGSFPSRAVGALRIARSAARGALLRGNR